MMRRRLLGIIAATLIIVGVGGLVAGSDPGSQWHLFASAFVKSGFVLGALWLAFPQIAELSTRVPPWFLGALVIGGISIAIRPRSIVVIGPLLAALSFMQLLGKVLQSATTPAKRTKRPISGGKNRGP